MTLKQQWSILQQGITKLKNILERLPDEMITSSEYILLYTAVYNICDEKGSPDNKQLLYNRYKETIVEYINTMVLPALRDKHGEFLLKEFMKRWDNHKLLVLWLSRFFSYLERYFIHRSSLPNLNEVGFMCFQDQVYEETKNNIQHALITLINREREGEQIDRALLKNFPRIFVEIGMGSMDVYENHFELAMLTETSAYYSRKVSSWIGEYSLQDYMLKAEECLQKEKERVGHYLHTSSGPKLLQRVQHELLTQNLLKTEPSVWDALVKYNKVEDLSRMYRLYVQIPNGLKPIAAVLKQHITREGIALIKQAEDAAVDKKDFVTNVIDQSFMKNVIHLHDKYLWQVSKCFVDNNIFKRAIKEAFEVFCRKTVAGSTSAELLATFCDDLLKKRGSERLSDEEIEDTVEKVLKVLACISDIDMFGEFYQNKLALRLLSHKGVNDDHERSILTKLKERFGGRFTSKIERMVTDLTLAKESQITFKDHLNSNSTCNLGIDFTVTVLTKGSWPNFKSSDLALPTEMVKCVEVFEEFYQAKTKHRKLAWIHSMGTCAINVQFDAKMIELIVTTYQAAVLVLFNEAERLNYADIKGQLHLGDEDIVRILHSLACGKQKILHKNPSTEMVTQTDSFELNSKFTDKRRSIKIPLPPMDERKKVKADFEKDRRYAIESSVVRIMKSRKVFPCRKLVLECTEQLGGMFTPDFKDIKKSIEDLITREYLERDKEDSTKLRYLA